MAPPASLIGVRQAGGLLTFPSPHAREGGGAVDYYEASRQWELVPRRLFRREDCALYLAEAPGPLVSNAYGFASLSEPAAVGVFARPAASPEEPGDAHHVAELFIAAGNHLARDIEQLGLGFLVGRVLWLLLYKGGDLTYISSHHVDSEADAVFYIAAHYQHFGLDRATCPFYVGGGLDPVGQLHRQLEIYFDLHSLSLALRERQDPLVLEVELLFAYEEALRQEISDR